MAKSISRTGKKSRGRPRTDPTSIHLTLLPDQLAALDSWIAKQKEGDLSRPEAIRRLVGEGLAGSKPHRPPSKAAAHKASDLAAETIERLTPTTHAPEEKQRVRRRLIQGPKEFRGIRNDQPKRK